MRFGLALAVAACAAALWAAPASAAPIPSGDYTAEITGGQLDIASGYPGALPVPGIGGSVPVTVPNPPAPLNWSSGTLAIPTTAIPDQHIVAPLLTVDFTNGSVSATMTQPLTVSLDPATGSASASVAGYAELTGTLTVTGLGSTTLDCKLGTPTSPIAFHLTTPSGSEWNPTTGVISIEDGSFDALLNCTTNPDNPLIKSYLPLVLGDTTSGHNRLRLDAVIKPAPRETTDYWQGEPPQTGTQQVAGDRHCIVPKLKGKKLKRAKRMIKRAGCAVGKVKRKPSKKKPGTVLGQRPKAGTSVPVGTKVRLVVAKKR